MGINLGALKQVHKDLVDKSGEGGNKLWMQQKAIGEATDFRLVIPHPSLNGIYFLEVTVWWINKKRYISPITFGKNCPIDAEIEEAKEAEDEELVYLAKDKEACKKSTEFWMAGLLLNPVFDPDSADEDNPDIIDFKVVDDMVKILSAGPQLMTRINKVVTSRKANSNGSEDGITDRVVGSNIILSKTGSKMTTKYDAELGEQWEMPAKYYKEVPDLIKLAKDGLKSDNYLEGVVRNYLYGEDMPEEEKKPAKDKEPAKPAAKTAVKRKPAPVVEEEEEEEELPYEEEEETEEEYEEEEEEEEEEEPAPVKKVAKKAAAPVAPVKKKAAAVVPAKTTKKRSAFTDLNNFD